MKPFFSSHSFGRQIILTFVGGFLLSVAAFSAYLFDIETHHLYEDSSAKTAGLAESLAASSRSWVLARDLSGLQEVVQSFRDYPELRYAMIISPLGRVLAHTDPNKVGQYISDEKSLALLKTPPARQVMVDNDSVIDIAVPIEIEEHSLGWARIALGRESIAGHLHEIALSYGTFITAATLLSLLAAFLIARRLGHRIDSLVQVAEKVQSGNFETRAEIEDKEDEIAKLSASFNQMLDTLAQNEAKLRDASHYTRSLIEASLDPLVTISPEGKITDVNRATEEATGIERGNLIGTDFSDYFTEPETAREGYRKVFQEGHVTDYPLAIRRRDGQITDVLYNASLYRDASGYVLGVFAAARDITERKRAEIALRQREHFLDTVVDHIPNMLFVKEVENLSFVRFNKAGEDLLGYSRQELLGKSDYDFFPKEEADFFIAKDREIISEKKLLDIPEEPISTKFLGKRYLHTRKIPIFADDGTPLYLLGISEDITDRKLAEEGLRKSKHSLAEAQRIAHLGNWELDLSNNELTWSDEIYRIFEIDSEKTAVSYATFLEAIHPDDREMVNLSYLESVDGKKPYDIEHRLLMKDGRVKYVNEKGETYYDEEGRPLRSVGTVHDITERKKTEEELRRYKDHLEEEVQQRTADLVLARNAAEAANQAKSAFLANMSHELRTPLNAILGFSNIIRRDPLLPEGERQNIDIIHRSGEHLLTLINEVLEMAKIEAGRVQIENTPFDLGGLIRDVTDMMQVRADEKGLRLSIDQSSQFPRYIVGDEARLRQVLINLMGNAIKFTGKGGVTVRLGVKKENFPHLVIEVEDTGPGIAPEDQQRIFEPFVQLGEQGGSQGTGLGLTITRQYMQLMGGSIGLESMPGKGSLFRIDLPLREKVKDGFFVPEREDKGEVIGLEPGQPDYRILIVEDHRDNQVLLSKLMEAAGFKSMVAENGAKGVELFQSWHPHLIWMDRRMPVMDGLEATRRIRALQGGREVRIVAVTASAFTEQREELIEAGMDDFVRKPYRSGEIYECMTKLLGVRFVYERSEQKETEPILTPEMLSVLPGNLRMDLKTALESLERRRIDAALREVGQYNPVLRNALQSLVENFNYPAILKVLQASAAG